MTGARSAERGAEPRADLLIGLVLAGVTIAAYGPIWSLGFVNYDDPAYVTDNPHVLGGLGWAGIVWAFTTTTESNWHPVTWLSLMLDASVGGGTPRVFHATNLLLHVANTLLIFTGLRRMTGRRWESAFVAALFAVHPLHVESVAWVAERKDVLSTLLWLLTVAAYVRWVGAPSASRYVVVLIVYALGLMAKPMLVSLPLTLLLLDYWPLARVKDGAAARRVVLEKIPLFVLAGLLALVTLLVQRPAMQALEAVPFGARAANALVSVVAYLLQMLWPVDLAVIYPYPRAGRPLWQPIAATATLAVVSFAALRSVRERPWLAAGWLFYLVTLVPVLGLVQVGYHARADRFTYVPLLGIFVIVAWGVSDRFGRAGVATAPAPSRASRRDKTKARSTPSVPAGARGLAAVAATIVVVLSVLTWRQVGRWRSSIDLFSHAVAVTSDNAYAQYNLSTAYQEAGDAERTIVHLREALRIHPELVDAHYNLTRLLMKRGQLDEAATLVREQQRLWPSSPHTMVDLGVLAVLQGDNDAAIRWFTEALRLSPDLPDARNNLQALERERAAGR